MASIRKEIVLNISADDAWSAVRDVGAVHKKLAIGFVTDCRLEGNARIVTFANGLVVRELIVDIDDVAKRVAYAAVGGRPTHHNASMQIYPDGSNRCRLVWITDLLPNEMADPIGGMMEQGAAIMKQTLERNERR